jgi:hypothetical protein
MRIVLFSIAVLGSLVFCTAAFWARNIRLGTRVTTPSQPNTLSRVVIFVVGLLGALEFLAALATEVGWLGGALPWLHVLAQTGLLCTLIVILIMFLWTALMDIRHQNNEERALTAFLASIAAIVLIVAVRLAITRVRSGWLT